MSIWVTIILAIIVVVVIMIGLLHTYRSEWRDICYDNMHKHGDAAYGLCSGKIDDSECKHCVYYVGNWE